MSDTLIGRFDCL